MLTARKGWKYESVKEIIIENTNSKDNEERALEDNNNEEESRTFVTTVKERSAVHV